MKSNINIWTPNHLIIDYKTVVTVAVCTEPPASVNIFKDFLGQKVWWSKVNMLIIKENLWTNSHGNDM